MQQPSAKLPFVRSALASTVVLLALSSVLPSASAQTLTTLVNFNNTNGAYPSAGLVQGTDGNFYGTTSNDGILGYGTVFRMTPSGSLTTLVRFKGSNGASPNGLIQGSDGNFYGTTYFGGGINAYGTVFKMTPEGTLTTLVRFNGRNGKRPFSDLVQGSDGNFYGTTPYGGISPNCFSARSLACGTVFKMTPDGTLTTLVNFLSSLTVPSQPSTGLVQGSDGNFYGATAYSGTSDYGMVFKMTSSGTLTTLANFNFDNGIAANRLVQGSDGNFYGTTYGGGSGSNGCFNGCGTAFKMTPDGTLTTLANFDDSAVPNPGLVQGSDGNFYGTSYSGGSSEKGTVFKMTPEGALTTLVNFNGTNGSYPSAGLVQGSDGNFYGTTTSGGSSTTCGSVGCGTVFKLTLP